MSADKQPEAMYILLSVELGNSQGHQHLWFDTRTQILKTPRGTFTELYPVEVQLVNDIIRLVRNCGPGRYKAIQGFHEGSYHECPVEPGETIEPGGQDMVITKVDREKKEVTLEPLSDEDPDRPRE